MGQAENLKNLFYTSPAEIKRLVQVRWSELQFDKWVKGLEHRQTRFGYKPENSWDQQLVTDLVSRSGLKGRQYTLAHQLVAGTAPTGQWLHEHGWKTTGACGCGHQDTLTHILQGCRVRAKCPVEHVSDQVGFWKLLERPDIPELFEEKGLFTAMQDGYYTTHEELEFGQGSIYLDGSVKWPRWKCLATGGYSAVKKTAGGVTGLAIAHNKRSNHTAVNMEHAALASTMTCLSDDSRLVVDCSAVVTGFKQLPYIADNPNKLFAGTWRFVRHHLELLQEDDIKIQVVKVKAHRNKADVQEGDMDDFIGNELADEWAKRAASNRPEARADAAEKCLQSNLRRARRVVKWLATQEWPDSKLLGKQQVQARCPKNREVKHCWVWNERWWCRVCGVRSRNRHTQKCIGEEWLSQVHASHNITLARMNEVPVALCTRCGGAKTGRSGGLRKHCKLMRSNPGGRLELISQCRHPYNKTRLNILGKIRQETHLPEREVRHGHEQVPQGHQEGHQEVLDYGSQDEEHELALMGLGLVGPGQEDEVEEDPFGWGCGFD